MLPVIGVSNMQDLTELEQRNLDWDVAMYKRISNLNVAMCGNHNLANSAKVVQASILQQSLRRIENAISDLSL